MKVATLIMMAVAVSACSTPITKTHYMDMVKYDMSPHIRKNMTDSNPVYICLPPDANRTVAEIDRLLNDCAKEKVSGRPDEISLRAAQSYMAEDNDCAIRRFVYNHMDEFDLNQIPRNRIQQCLAFKDQYER